MNFHSALSRPRHVGASAAVLECFHEEAEWLGCRLGDFTADAGETSADQRMATIAERPPIRSGVDPRRTSSPRDDDAMTGRIYTKTSAPELAARTRVFLNPLVMVLGSQGPYSATSYFPRAPPCERQSQIRSKHPMDDFPSTFSSRMIDRITYRREAVKRTEVYKHAQNASTWRTHGLSAN